MTHRKGEPLTRGRRDDACRSGSRPVRAAAALLLISVLLPQTGTATNWTPIFQTPTNETPRVLSSPSNEVCWFITTVDRLYKTADGGQNWTAITSGVSIPTGLFVVDQLTAFRTGSGVVYRTTNGGNSWAVVFSPGGGMIPEVWMIDASLGFLTHGGVLYRTVNGGTSWSTSGITQPPIPVGLSHGRGTLWYADGSLWVALDDSGVARSSDLGGSWTLPLNDGLRFGGGPRIAFGTAQFGVAIYANWPFVYTTTDGGEHWSGPENSLGSNEDVQAFGTQAWYIPNPADHFYIKHSTDLGASWTIQLEDPAGFEVLNRSRSGSTLWAGTTTGKIYTYLEPDPAAVSPATGPEAGLRAFPNPGNDVLRLDMTAPTIAGGGPLRYRFFTADGSLRASGETPAGSIDTRSLRSGLYLLEVTDPATGARLRARWIKR